jgi:hypothetical protein
MGEVRVSHQTASIFKGRSLAGERLLAFQGLAARLCCSVWARESAAQITVPNGSFG